jgi:site-specific DNA-methyltransferase (adenine-specific)
MSMAEIKALPLADLADKNAVLFMWCTFPYLNEQIKLFEHWGFRYRTLGFSWIKTNPVNHQPFFGVGYYAKSNCEVCLMGMKGQLKPISNRVSSVIIAPRREHSQKPDEARSRIVELFGDLPRLELFAREQAPGWQAVGQAVDGLDINESLKKLKEA